ncbi:hypothetical protein OIV83_002889 [Microbotryomycetes sp. JL201]|nr:hypothetical protein OIV83_002889 [Microbotryomycetes sp. JL201]
MLSSVDAVPSTCDLLILGGGWTYTFLKPLLDEHHKDISYVATTRDGRDGTLKWSWDAEHDGSNDYDALPTAKTVVVVFPLKGKGTSSRLVQGYEHAHGQGTRWIQLGSTGIFDGGPTLKRDQNLSEKLETAKANFKWTDRHSPYNVDNDRAIAEDELLSLTENAFVLNLCGLWGGMRDPANWFGRIAPSKEALAAKGSVHFVHGLDVARAIVAVHRAKNPKAQDGLEDGRRKLKGQRYIVTDLRVYDWWDIASAWAASSAPDLAAKDAGQWVVELMDEHDIRALPRTPQEIGRAMDSREFWQTFGMTPIKGRWERARA